jgi:hypothetical protein
MAGHISEQDSTLMRVERPPTRRSRTIPLLGCGCLTLAMACIATIVGALLLLPALPGLVLQTAGFQSEGSTAAVFAAVTPPPVPAVQNAVSPTQIVVELGSYGSETLDTNQYAYTVAVGSDAGGGQLATVTFTESDLMALCMQRTTLCGAGNGQVRGARFDLRPGGAVVYADVLVPQLNAWQNLGVVLRVDGSGRQLQAAGVDVGGVLYAAPPNELGSILRDVETAANDVLRQLALSAGGTRFTLDQARVDDTTLTLILR